ncbi:Polyketide biosynthesis protein PksE [Streptomyces xanthophaeus]|uniref:acyltransferase domain-containing protein n=1 Tax=Streptomyces xanthophaeus TaxID=67385 RepID=UPI00233E7537|nr:acyltransferase domain-containing protein [Streptomyces xanthophaeus]WCD85206.1 Polyketide biosynthesis protein PksE [Streptomyces xanthophaeus]
MSSTPPASGPVLLFPGQGGFDGAAFSRAVAGHPQLRAVFECIDPVTEEAYGRRLTDTLFQDSPLELAQLLRDEAWVSQLAIYGTGLAAYRILTDNGVRPSVLVGHSLGEITALVAAGAYSLEDGARIVLRRTSAIAGRDTGSGAMVALSASPERSAGMVALVGDPALAVATENHDAQTVLSGPGAAIAKVKAVAEQLGIGFAQLDASFAFHNPTLAGAAPGFAADVRGLRQRPLAVPVYSPILQRFYEDDESLGDRLADHFTQPVRFSAAVRFLHERGERTFVEAGGRATLASLVPKALLGVAAEDLTVLSTLSVGRGNALRLPDTLETLREAGLASRPGGLDAVRLHLAPGLSEDEFTAFWAQSGREVADLVARRLTAFRDTAGATGIAVASAAPAPAPAPAVEEPRPAATAAPADRPGREEVFAVLRTLYAQALEYPEEVFTPGALLEAELGVDSVKQVELLSRASTHYGLPARASDFRLGDYETLDKIAGLVTDELGSLAGPSGPAEPAPAPAAAPADSAPAEEEVFAVLRTLYAQALEYPEEVFTPDALLEAELGVDSVKQVELLSRASTHYGLPARASDFRLGDYETLDKIAGLITDEVGRLQLDGAAA